MVNTSRLFIFLLCISVSFMLACSRDTPLRMDTYGNMPDFSLQDQGGYNFEKNDMIGKVALVDFIYTNCTDSCSLLSSRMKDVQGSVEKKGLGSSQVILLSFSVDGMNDTPDVLMSYANRYNANNQRWKLLTGSSEIVVNVAKDLKLPFYNSMKETEHLHEDGYVHMHEYEIKHSGRILLIDKNGMVRRYYDPRDQWDIGNVIADVQYLLE